ncbi:MAG: hypothetical protein ACLP5H_11390 [Desulfomonilaceae bacterium]
MTNRVFVTILVLIALTLAVTSYPIVAADSAPSTGFNLDACYAQCPCNRGLVDHSCAVCKQQCEWQNWKHLNEKSKKKGD